MRFAIQFRTILGGVFPLVLIVDVFQFGLGQAPDSKFSLQFGFLPDVPGTIETMQEGIVVAM